MTNTYIHKKTTIHTKKVKKTERLTMCDCVCLRVSSCMHLCNSVQRYNFIAELLNTNKDTKITHAYKHNHVDNHSHK